MDLSGKTSTIGPTSFTQPSVRYVITDHLGTPIMETDEDRMPVWQAEYEPYGNIYTMRAGAATDQPLRLPGQEAVWHSPSGAEENYNIHRWYRAGWGRYTQADPAAMSPDTSLYGYSYENPLRGTDPLGLRAGDAYATADAAAIAAIREVCSLSRTIDREFGGYIYRLPNRQFTYTVPLHGLKHGMDNLGAPSEELPRGVRAVGSYHTHGDKSELNPFIEHNDEEVSNDDMVTAHRQGFRAYVGTPFGTIWRYDPLPGPHDQEMRHAPPDSGHLKRIDHCDCPYVPAHHEPWIY
jgi:RHS repeat-associated protein